MYTFNSLIAKVISMLMLMTLAINRIHNLPPHQLCFYTT